MDFARFINDQDMWSRWNIIYDPKRDEYFEKCLIMVAEKKLGSSVDFNQINEVHVMSKDEGTLNWEHDGESLFYFYCKFMEGKRI